MKFRKKPVVVEAVQWDGTQESLDNIVALGLKSMNSLDFYGEFFFIQTLEGNYKASKGDWVIKGVNGEFYLCKPDIFEKTYEKVEEVKNGEFSEEV